MELKEHENPTKTSTPLKRDHPLSWWLKWIASIILIIAMIFTSNNMYPYNLFLHFIGIGGWLWVSILWKEGNEIIIMTARGKRSGIDSTEFTKQQLKEFDIPYDSLIMNVKPHADVFVDDKAWNARDWRSSTKEPNWLKKT